MNRILDYFNRFIYTAFFIVFIIMGGLYLKLYINMKLYENNIVLYTSVILLIFGIVIGNDFVKRHLKHLLASVVFSILSILAVAIGSILFAIQIVIASIKMVTEDPKILIIQAGCLIGMTLINMLIEDDD